MCWPGLWWVWSRGGWLETLRAGNRQRQTAPNRARFAGGNQKALNCGDMKRLLLCVPLLFLCSLRAQTPTDVNLNFLAQGDGTFGGPLGYYDNRANQAVTWTVAYESDGGITGYTIAFQYAQGATAPGSFSALTPVASSSSFGTAQYGIATYNVLSATPGSSIASDFLQVAVSGGGGTGSIRIQMYGYKTGPTGGTGGGGGGGGGSGCSSPCPVVGTAAAGAPPSGDPVQVGGSDGTDIRTIKTDTSGDVLVSQIGRPTFTSGQQAVTGSAVNLGSNATTSLCVHAFIGNTINVYAGASGVTTSTGMEIPPGQGFCWTLANTNLVYVIASTTGASVSYTYTN
jgi:hypothetical protein